VYTVQTTNQLDKLQISFIGIYTPKKKHCFYLLGLMDFYFPSCFLFGVEVGMIVYSRLKMFLSFSCGSGEGVGKSIYVFISSMPVAQCA